MQRLECRSRRTGRDTRREDERPAHMAQPIGHTVRGQHTASDGCQRLGEGQHGDVHLVSQSEMRRRSATAGTQHAETVRIVHHHLRVVFLCQTAYLRQLAYVSAHGEHAVGDDQFACIVRYRLQLPLQVLHVGVPVTQHFRVTQPAGVVYRRMVLAVIEDIVVLAADSRDNSEVGLETR